MSSDIFNKFKKIFKFIAMVISWTVFCILVIIIAFLVYYLVCTNLYATKGQKYEPRFSLYTIISPSMEDTIKVYDVILDVRVDDPAEIKEGDVITFISTSNISNGMTVTHRVVGINQGENGLEFKTQGDNNKSADTDTAKAENVLGRVVLKIPQLGRLQFFLSSNGGWLLVIIFPALFIIVNDIFKIIKLTNTKKMLDEITEEDNKDKNNKKEFPNDTQEDLNIEIIESDNEFIEDFKVIEDVPKVGFFARIIQAYQTPSNEESKLSDEKRDIDTSSIIDDMNNSIEKIESEDNINDNDDQEKRDVDTSIIINEMKNSIDTINNDKEKTDKRINYKKMNKYKKQGKNIFGEKDDNLNIFKNNNTKKQFKTREEIENPNPFAEFVKPVNKKEK